MLDWSFPESLDNGYEEFEGSATGRDFGSTTMLPRSPAAITLVPPPSSEPSSSTAAGAAISSSSTNSNTIIATMPSSTTNSSTITATIPSSTTTTTTTATTTPPSTNAHPARSASEAGEAPAPAPAPALPLPPTSTSSVPGHKGATIARSTARGSLSAPGTMTDLPSISTTSSSSTVTSPASRPAGAFRLRRPAAASAMGTTETSSPNTAGSCHLDDRPTCWWYSKGSVSIDSDFILISEFSEIEGPRAVMTIPDNIIDLTFDSFAAAKQRDGGGAGARSLGSQVDGEAPGGSARDQQRAFDVHEFVLRITSVDHQSREMSDGFHIPEDIEVYVCESDQQYWAYVHHFTLFDVNARGFVRPFNLSYVTKDPNKILPNYEDIRRKFSKAAQYFKMGNYALFRHELARKLKDLHYTSSLLSESSDATEKPTNDPAPVDQPPPSPGHPLDHDTPPSPPSQDQPSSNCHDSSNSNDIVNSNPSNTNNDSSDSSSNSNNHTSNDSSDDEQNFTKEGKESSKRLSEAGSSLAAIESTKAELRSIQEAIEQANQIISTLEHYSIDGQPLLGPTEENGDTVQPPGPPAPLSEVSPMNSSENLASIAAGRSAALNDMSLFLGAHGRSGLRIRRKGSTHNVARILEGSGAVPGVGGATAAGGTTLESNLAAASSPLLTGLQEQSRKNSIVSEYESTMLHEPEYEPQFITSLYPLARDEIVFRTLRELCVTPMFWNSSIHFHLGIKKLKDILKDYHDDALLLKQTADDLRRMHPTSSSLTFGHRFQINFRNPDFTSTTVRPSSSSPPNDDPSPVPLVELLHGISMANTLSDDGDSVMSLAHQQRQPHPSTRPLQQPPSHPPTSAASVAATTLQPRTAVSAAAAAHFDADDADDEETGYDSLDDTSSFFTAATGPAGHFVDTPTRDSFTVTPVDRSARVVEWRQEQHSLRHKRSSRTLPGDHAAGEQQQPCQPPTAFEAGINLRDMQPFVLHHSHSTQRLSDGAFGSAAGGPGAGSRPNRLSTQSGISGGVGVMVPGGGHTMIVQGSGPGPGVGPGVGAGTSGYVGGGGGQGPTTRISLTGSLILETLGEEAETAKHLLFALWSGKRVCITGGPEHEGRIRQYVAVLSVLVPHVGFPTREEQLLEHQRQVVPWHQGYDILRASDFATVTATTTTAASVSSAKPSASSPPTPAAPPLLLVGVDRARMDPAILERKDICTLQLDTLEMAHPVDYADGLVLETIFRSLDQGLFSDDGSFLAFVDSALFELLLKAFLYYHLVLCHRLFQHPHLLQHLHVGGGGNGGPGYGYQSFYSSACSDDGETFSYHRQYRRPPRQQSSSSNKLSAMSTTGGKQYHTLPSSVSPPMLKPGEGSAGLPHSDRALFLSSRESSDTEKAYSHQQKYRSSHGVHSSQGVGGNGGGGGRSSTMPGHSSKTTSSSHMDWTRRLSKRTPKGKDRYRQQQQQQHKIVANGGAGLIDESTADDDDEDPHGEDAHPMQYTTMQGMRKWKKWFDYWSAKSAAMIDPALAVFGKPESQTGHPSRSGERDRPSGRRSSPNGYGLGHRRAKTMQVSHEGGGGGGGGGRRGLDGGSGNGVYSSPSQQQQQQQHHTAALKSREYRERHERGKERDRKRDRERDSKATGANFDMRHYSEPSSGSEDGRDGTVEKVEEEQEGALLCDGTHTLGHSRAASSSHPDTEKDLPLLPKDPKVDPNDSEVGLGISSHGPTLSKEQAQQHHHNNNHLHFPSALKRLSGSSRKLQPKVPLVLHPTKKGEVGEEGGGGVESGNHGSGGEPKSPHSATTSTPASPPGSGALRGFTGALRAMSFGSAFGSPTTTTSTTAVIATATSGSTTTTTSTSPSPPPPPPPPLSAGATITTTATSTSHGLLSPLVGSSLRPRELTHHDGPPPVPAPPAPRSSHELSDRSVSEGTATTAADKVKRRGSKRAKAKAWLEAKRKKHWHRHGSKDASAPYTADEEDEEDEEGEEGEEEIEDEAGEKEVAVDDDGRASHEEQPLDGKSDRSSPNKTRRGDSSPSSPLPLVTGADTAEAKLLGPSRCPSDATIAGVEVLSPITEDLAFARTIIGEGSPRATYLTDMLTIEEIAQLEPTCSSTRTWPQSPPPPSLSTNALSSVSLASKKGEDSSVNGGKSSDKQRLAAPTVGDISGRESATEYETSIETWATQTDRTATTRLKEGEGEEGEGRRMAEHGGRPSWQDGHPAESSESTRTVLDHSRSRPSLDSDPYELTEEVVAVVKELVGGIAGEDDWAIVTHLAKLVYAYEKNKEATASPSSDK